MGTEEPRIVSSTISFFRAFIRVSGFYSLCVFFLLLLRCRFSSFPEEFSMFLIGTRWLSRRAHASMFRSASFSSSCTQASAVHSGSKSNSSVYRLNSWLHSISVWVFDKRFRWNPFGLLSWNLFAVCSLGHEILQEAVGHLCWGLNPVYVVLRERFCCIPMFMSIGLCQCCVS